MSDELEWFKSSYSGPEGDACLEAALDWRTSSYSDDEGANCLEVSRGVGATSPEAVHVRDSKDPVSPILTLSAPAWSAFIAAVQPGA
ncbi:DUF397 domain-containing protein [Streptomyces venezuelae]|uniref:DUF397 domain-containing protein n=1 Tax=Streptomyces venezuelae TaxID=54571 RepID=A0A5P2BZM6_STRVZ|nr:DUF397 domain-containing protein [Streptomyces venezuelae]QES35108.1 DUF397 domain-containing protein [Streptomyces venezuelae]